MGRKRNRSIGSERSLAELRGFWRDRLLDDDVNSVHSQLTQLSVDIATFLIVIRPDSIRVRARTTPLPNPLMRDFLSRGFAALTISCLRRVAEAGIAEGPKGVHSIIAVIDSMLEHTHLLTRQNLLELEELPYDWSVQEEEFNAEIGRIATSASSTFFSTNVRPWMRSKARHDQLDRLCQVRRQDRKPKDTISRVVLESAADSIRMACEPAVTVANKYIAHSSTKDSRIRGGIMSTGLTIREIRNAHEACCKVTAFLVQDVLGSSCAPFMPIFAYDHLAGVDKPIVSSTDVGRVRTEWSAFKGNQDGMSPWQPPNAGKEWAADIAPTN